MSLPAHGEAYVCASIDDISVKYLWHQGRWGRVPFYVCVLTDLSGLKGIAPNSAC